MPRTPETWTRTPSAGRGPEGRPRVIICLGARAAFRLLRGPGRRPPGGRGRATARLSPARAAAFTPTGPASSPPRCSSASPRRTACCRTRPRAPPTTSGCTPPSRPGSGGRGRARRAAPGTRPKATFTARGARSRGGAGGAAMPRRVDDLIDRLCGPLEALVARAVGAPLDDGAVELLPAGRRGDAGRHGGDRHVRGGRLSHVPGRRAPRPPVVRALRARGPRAREPDHLHPDPARGRRRRRVQSFATDGEGRGPRCACGSALAEPWSSAASAEASLASRFGRIVRVLVTGSAGTVGRPLCEELARPRARRARAGSSRRRRRSRTRWSPTSRTRRRCRRRCAAWTRWCTWRRSRTSGRSRSWSGPNVVGLYNVMDAAREQAVKRRRARELDDGRAAGWEEPGRPGARRRPPPQQPLRADQGVGGADGRAVRAALRHEHPSPCASAGWCAIPDEARHMSELGIFDCYVSRADGARCPRRRRRGPRRDQFEIVYAASLRRRARVRHGAGAAAARVRGAAALAGGAPVPPADWMTTRTLNRRRPLRRLLALAWDYRGVCAAHLRGAARVAGAGAGRAGGQRAGDRRRPRGDRSGARPPVRWPLGHRAARRLSPGAGR